VGDGGGGWEEVEMGGWSWWGGGGGGLVLGGMVVWEVWEGGIIRGRWEGELVGCGVGGGEGEEKRGIKWVEGFG